MMLQNYDMSWDDMHRIGWANISTPDYFLKTKKIADDYFSKILKS
jgi:hypothetical protein